jgi:hypothetical protein
MWMRIRLGRSAMMLKLLSAAISMTSPVSVSCICILLNPYLLQRTSRFFMGPREVASQKCCPIYSRTESGTYRCCISLAYSALLTLVRDSPVLIIDCAELLRANSDTRLIEALSRQTGYWPVFTFLNSMNNLIDLASVGLIGQKGMLSEK